MAANSSLDSSDRFLDGITTKLRRLAQFPNLGRSRDELSLRIRSLPYGKYLIFYRVQDTAVEILRVVSGYQDLDRLFEDNEG